MNAKTLARWLFGIGVPLAVFTLAPYLIPPRRRPLFHGHELASAEDRFASVDGFRMRYRAHGPEDSTRVPLILIHGVGGSVITWHRNIDALSAERRVYAIDLKGWGLTDKPGDSDYSLVQQAHHVRAFMRAMGEERAILVGHSMGGAISVVAAAEYPRAIPGIVLVDPAGARVLSYLWMAGRLMEVPPLRRWASLVVQYASTFEPLISSGMPNAYHDPDTHLTPDMKRQLLQPLHTHGYVDAVISTSRHMHHGQIHASMPHIDCPALVLWGANDNVLPPSDARYFLDGISAARLVILPQAGHQAHEEQSGEVNRLIGEFATGVDA